MSMLEGGIRSVFGRAFGRLLLPGTLIKQTRQDDGAGGWALVETSYPIRGQLDRATEEMLDGGNSRLRQTVGYSATPMKIIVLQHGVPVDIDTDDEIVLRGKRWKVASVRRDPADSHWILLGYGRTVAPPPSGPTDTGGTT